VSARVACVTGAGRGIGRDAALLLAAEGHAVHVSDVDLAAAEAVVAEIETAGGTAYAQVCDVSDEASVTAMMTAIGRLDVLVANAGIYPRLDFFATTVADFDRVMGINVRGVFLCTMAAVSHMPDGGSIVVLSSAAGQLDSLQHETAKTLPLYGASKAAVDRWALNAAGYLASRGIALNVLHPAGILTDQSRALGLREEYVATMQPPSVVAPAIAWLARQTPATFAGQLVRVADFGKTWGDRQITDEDLLAIVQVLSLYAQVIDDHAWPRLTEIFTPDAVIDHTPNGSKLMAGVEDAAASMSAGMTRHPIAHHLTNPVVVATGAGTVRVRSKWLVIDTEGKSRSGYYLDDFVTTADGWRISHRVASPRFK
jgi:3-oxoacyl-[acyl-carrier protein] reductase